jgi:hypothetical protein
LFSSTKLFSGLQDSYEASHVWHGISKGVVRWVQATRPASSNPSNGHKANLGVTRYRAWLALAILKGPHGYLLKYTLAKSVFPCTTNNLQTCLERTNFQLINNAFTTSSFIHHFGYSPILLRSYGEFLWASYGKQVMVNS